MATLDEKAVHRSGEAPHPGRAATRLGAVHHHVPHPGRAVSQHRKMRPPGARLIVSARHDAMQEQVDEPGGQVTLFLV